MKIEGYVICQPVNTWGDKTKVPWNPRMDSFGATMQEAWSRLMWHNHNVNYENPGWYRFQNEYVKRGYCPKKATMEVDYAS